MNSWCGCLRPPAGAPTLRALEDLQQRLLDALARHVAGDRRVLALTRDLVDLVDVDDAGLCPLDVVVGGLDQLEEDVLDVLTDITGLGERGGVGDREGHVEHLRESLSEVGLAAARGAEQKNVRLGEFDRLTARVACLVAGLDALVVVVDSHSERPLRRSWPMT